jgi:hypothetical protein
MMSNETSLHGRKSLTGQVLYCLFGCAKCLALLVPLLWLAHACLSCHVAPCSLLQHKFEEEVCRNLVGLKFECAALSADA